MRVFGVELMPPRFTDDGCTISDIVVDGKVCGVLRMEGARVYLTFEEGKRARIFSERASSFFKKYSFFENTSPESFAAHLYYLSNQTGRSKGARIIDATSQLRLNRLADRVTGKQKAQNLLLS